MVSKVTLLLFFGGLLTLLGRVQACSDPGQPPNSNRYVTGINTGDTVAFTCNTGFELANDVTTLVMECLASGHWNDTMPNCRRITCGDPGETLNTTYTGNYMYEDVVEYVCSAGYRMPDWSKRLDIVCEANKRWNPLPVGCVRIECIEPEVIPFANRTSAMTGPYWLSNILSYECWFGYRPREPAHLLLECGDRGFWDGSWPECLKIRCGDPGMVENAGRIVTGNGAGTVLIYSCNRGYVHDSVNSGPLNRTCQENAEWTGSGQPVCLGVYCGAPSRTVAHATFTPTTPTYRFPETLKYTCDAGYRANYSLGIDEITCTYNGLWDFQPSSCDRVRCIETSMSENTIINNAYYYYNDTKVMHCLTGYERSNGSLVRTCDATGYFSDSPPLCTKVRCPDPHADPTYNQHVNITGDGVSYRQIVTFTCHTGYEVTGGQSLTFRQSAICQSDRTWEPVLPICARVSCGAPDLRLNVQLELYTGHYYGDQVMYNCSYGYEQDRGDRVSTCLETRRWSGETFQCIEQACPGLAPFDNGERIGQNFRYKGQVSFRCDLGFQLNGQQTIKCQADGSWTYSQPTCDPISCGMPESLPHTTWTSHDVNATDYVYGDEVIYECNYGYYHRAASGALARTCTDNTRWSDRRPICDPYNCGDPGEVSGTYKLGVKYTYGEVVNYTCATGYEAQSGRPWSVITCSIEPIQWAGTQPTCTKIVCGDPGLGGNSTREATSFQYASTIRYYCNEGYYYPDGRYLLRCLETKNWSAPVPNCEAVPIFAAVSQPEVVVAPPAEADGAETYGYIGVALMAGEVLALIILDLVTIEKEIRLLRRNFNCKAKKAKKKIEEVKEEIKSDLDKFAAKAKLQMRFRAEQFSGQFTGAHAALVGHRFAPMQTKTGPPPYTKGGIGITPIETFSSGQDPPPYTGMNVTTAALLKMRAQKARAVQAGRLKTEIQQKEEDTARTARRMSVDMSQLGIPPGGNPASRRMSLPAGPTGMNVATAMMLKMRAKKARDLQKKGKAKGPTPPPPYESASALSKSVVTPTNITVMKKPDISDDSDDDWDMPRKNRSGKRKITVA